MAQVVQSAAPVSQMSRARQAGRPPQTTGRPPSARVAEIWANIRASVFCTQKKKYRRTLRRLQFTPKYRLQPKIYIQANDEVKRKVDLVLSCFFAVPSCLKRYFARWLFDWGVRTNFSEVNISLELRLNISVQNLYFGINCSAVMLTGNVVNHVVTNFTFSSCFSVTSITVFCFRCLLTSINRLCVALWSNTKKISSH